MPVIRDAATMFLALLGLCAAMPGGVSAQDLSGGTQPDIFDEPAVVAPEDEGLIGLFILRGAYNSDRGALLGAELETRRIFGREARLRLSGEVAEDDTRVNLSYVDPDLIGDNPAFGLRLSLNQSRASNRFAFDTQSIGIEPRLTWTLSGDRTASAYLTLATDDLDNLQPGASALIVADAGKRDRQALGGALSWQFGDGAGQAELGYELAMTSRDTSYHKITASVGMSRSLSDGRVVMAARLRGASLRMIDGESSIGDRFFLGGSALRGFEYAGFGPRDLTADDDPALGGQSYVVAKFDVQFPGDGERAFVPGAFLDVGSLWGLGGLDGAGIESGSDLRASVGLSVKRALGPGVLDISLAHPFEKQDFDRTQTLAIGFQASF